MLTRCLEFRQTCTCLHASMLHCPAVFWHIIAAFSEACSLQHKLACKWDWRPLRHQWCMRANTAPSYRWPHQPCMHDSGNMRCPGLQATQTRCWRCLISGQSCMQGAHALKTHASNAEVAHLFVCPRKIGGMHACSKARLMRIAKRDVCFGAACSFGQAAASTSSCYTPDISIYLLMHRPWCVFGLGYE